MEHYVYILFRDTGLPFYVGCGYKDRWLWHEKVVAKGRLSGNPHKDNIIRNMQAKRIPIEKVKIVSGLTKEESREIEKYYIKFIGREPDGPLVNQTDGGDGVLGLSDESLVKMGQALKATYAKPAVKRKMRKIRKEQWASEELRARQSVNTSKYFASEENRKKHGAIVKVTMAQPKVKAKVKRGIKKRWKDPKAHEEASIRSKCIWARPGYKEKASETAKLVRQDIDKNKRIIDSIRKAVRKPKYRKRMKRLHQARWDAASASAKKAHGARMVEVLADPAVNAKMKESSRLRWLNLKERERYRKIGKKAAEVRWGKKKRKK